MYLQDFDVLLSMGFDFEYCPECGEPVDRGLNDGMGVAPCEHCETEVEPVEEAEDASMSFKAKHPIQCTDCGESVELVGLHMGEYSDGVIVACSCFSLSAVPSELGEPELPSQWEMDHTVEL